MIQNKPFYKKVIEKQVCFYCGSFIVFVSVLALFAPWIAPYLFYEQFPDKILQSFSTEHWLGTDHLGRDLLSRIIFGARMSMAIGIFTTILSALLGISYGLISGWLGGVVDRILMRGIDIMHSIPTLVLLILVKVIFDSLNIVSDPEKKALLGTLIALTLISWFSLARVVRAQVLQVKEHLYIEATKSLGVPSWRVILFHILPNIISPIVILLTYQIPSNILFESMLSFLGLGLQPPFSSWGVLIDDGWRSLSTYPRLTIAPGLMLFLTMVAFNLFGDGLRDIFDIKMNQNLK